MMISSKESCGTDIPNTGGRHGMFSQGFYNPPYQISGQHYMAGQIADSGPFPVDLDPANPDEIFFGKMNIRESPSMSGVKTGKTTEVNQYYKVRAKSWGSGTTSANMKVGDRDQKWAKIEKDGKVLGWACIAETLKVADPAEQIVVSYAKPVPNETNLTDEELKKGIAEKKTQIDAINKWLSVNAPKKSSKSKDTTPDAPKAGAEESGLSTTSMVLIGLGAAALVYFLIQQGKKGR